MKILSVGVSGINIPEAEVVYSNLADSAPFGYDLIVCDPFTLQAVIGQGTEIHAITTRWKTQLMSWLGGKKKIVTLLRPFHEHGTLHNYSWLPVEGIISSKQDSEKCGVNTFIGHVVAEDYYTRNFLHDNDGKFSVIAYFNNHTAPHVSPNSKITDEIYTSFTWKKDNKEIIFVPFTTGAELSKILSNLSSNVNEWKTTQIQDLEGQIRQNEEKIDELEGEKQRLVDNLEEANSRVSALVEKDVYLRRAINSYNLAISSENPDPDNYYECIESIERAFGSEKKMRDALNVTKKFVDDVTSRTNEFRHVAKTGEKPQPLHLEEIERFSSKAEQLIRNYVQYLYDQRI